MPMATWIMEYATLKMMLFRLSVFVAVTCGGFVLVGMSWLREMNRYLGEARRSGGGEQICNSDRLPEKFH